MIKWCLPAALRRVKIIVSLTLFRNVELFKQHIGRVYMCQAVL